MRPHFKDRGVWLAVTVALAPLGGAAPESALPAEPSASPANASVVAPGPAGGTKPEQPKSRPRLSPALVSEISSAVKVWSPPPAEPALAPSKPPADPDVVKLEPLIVPGDRLPKTDRLDWLAPSARDVELVKTYITPFDRFFLNRFTLPIFGISREARARMMYEEEKRLRDLQWMNDQIDEIKRLDPEAAKSLRNARDTIFVRPQE